MRATLALASSPWAVRIGRGPVEEDPFPHLVVEACLDHDLADELLLWFAHDAPWTHVKRNFYEQCEFAISGTENPAAGRIAGPSATQSVNAQMASLFGEEFRRPPKIVAHKLTSGHRIDIHNDSLPGGETHRLLIQLNRGLQDDDGGFLMLFGSPDPSDVKKILRPVHCSATAFAISDSSYHAVSRMHSGDRYTLVYSFHAYE